MIALNEGNDEKLTINIKTQKLIERTQKTIKTLEKKNQVGTTPDLKLKRTGDNTPANYTKWSIKILANR